METKVIVLFFDLVITILGLFELVNNWGEKW